MTDTPPKLKVLAIDEYFPYPPDSGKPIRTWNLLSRLAKRHDISLLCYGTPADLLGTSSELKAEFVAPLMDHAGISLYSRLFANLFSPYPYSVAKHYTVRFAERLKNLLASHSYDLIHCEWTPYARYLAAVPELPSIIATHNIESHIWFRRAQNSGNPLSRLFFNMQAQKMETFERNVLQQASWVTAVSEGDAQAIRRWGIDRVSVVDNGVDLGFYQPDPTKEIDEEVLFLASLDWAPNIEGLQYFLSDIWPLLRAQRPSARLTIAGRKPSQELRDQLAGHPQIDFAGEVPDVRPYLEKASVVVVPLRVGGGSRLKILEAMGMGKAIVSTTVGAEGLAVKHDHHLLIADQPQHFAAAVTKLMDSPETRRRLGAAGRELVERQYGWDECANKLESAWFQTVEVGALKRTNI